MELTAHISEGSDPARAGLHEAVLAEVYDLGVQTGQYGRQHRAMLIFQVGETVEYDGQHRRKEVKGYFNVESGLGALRVNRSTGRAAFAGSKETNLRKWIGGWRGKPMSPEDVLEYLPEEDGGGGKKFDPEQLVGKPCQVLVEIQMGQESGKEYAKLVSILPPNEDREQRLRLDGNYRPWGERLKEWEARDAGESAVAPPPEGWEMPPAEDPDDDIPF